MGRNRMTDNYAIEIEKSKELMNSFGEYNSKMVVGTKNAIEKLRSLVKESEIHLEEGYVLPNRFPEDDDVIWIMPNLKQNFLTVKYEDDYEWYKYK